MLPRSPGQEPLLGLYVTVFYPSNPEPSTDVVMTMDKEPLPQLTAQPLLAGSAQPLLPKGVNVPIPSPHSTQPVGPSSQSPFTSLGSMKQKLLPIVL